MELAHVQQRGGREQAAFENEWRRLTTVIEQDRKAEVRRLRPA